MRGSSTECDYAAENAVLQAALVSEEEEEDNYPTSTRARGTTVTTSLQRHLPLGIVGKVFARVIS